MSRLGPRGVPAVINPDINSTRLSSEKFRDYALDTDRIKIINVGDNYNIIDNRIVLM
jgi:hypothetical protein